MVLQLWVISSTLDIGGCHNLLFTYFPNIQPALLQSEAITSCPVAVTWEERPTSTLLQPPFR